MAKEHSESQYFKTNKSIPVINSQPSSGDEVEAGEAEMPSQDEPASISVLFHSLKSFKSEIINHFDARLKPLGERLDEIQNTLQQATVRTAIELGLAA